ncbi:MAG: helix-turn-helix domain-containing protein [Planctomycetota bacterium]
MSSESSEFRDRLRTKQWEMERDRVVAERLRLCRNNKAVSLRRAAAETGIPYESLGGYERGDQRPPFSRIITLSTYYGVSTDFLGGLTDDPQVRGEHES